MARRRSEVPAVHPARKRPALPDWVAAGIALLLLFVLARLLWIVLSDFWVLIIAWSQP